MKSFFLLGFMLFSGIQLNAQVANSKWMATMAIPSHAEVIFDFKTDSVFCYIVETGDLIETMAFSVSNDTCTFVKLQGFSPCNSTDKGIYKLEWKEKNMIMKKINDDCPERIDAFNEIVFTKMD